MTKKKITFVIGRMSMGGAERVVLCLSNELCQYDNLEIHLISTYPANEDWEKRIDKRIIQHTVFKKSEGFFLIRYIKKIILTKSLLKKIDSDIIISFLTFNNISSILASFRIKSKLIISERCNPYIKKNWIVDGLQRLLYKHADGMIAQTNEAKNFYAKKYRCKNIIVIENPIQECFFNVKKTVPDSKTIITVGRLIQSKNHDRLIKIFQQSSALKNGWNLLILGDGPQKEILNETIRLSKLEQHVKIISGVTNVEDYLSRASIFAFSSESEGFPNSLAEAMVIGLPCISYNCTTGPAELIQDSFNGYLVPLFDDSEYVAKLDKMIEGRELRVFLGDNARQSTQRLKTKIIAKKYYNDIINA